MAFINETLTEQDKAWFASFNFQSVFTRDLVPVPRKWTIDRERDAVLIGLEGQGTDCLLYTSPSPRDRTRSRMPSSA